MGSPGNYSGRDQDVTSLSVAFQVSDRWDAHVIRCPPALLLPLFRRFERATTHPPGRARREAGGGGAGPPYFQLDRCFVSLSCDPFLPLILPTFSPHGRTLAAGALMAAAGPVVGGVQQVSDLRVLILGVQARALPSFELGGSTVRAAGCLRQGGKTISAVFALDFDLGAALHASANIARVARGQAAKQQVREA